MGSNGSRYDLMDDSYDYIKVHSSSILHQMSNNHRLKDLAP
jgi:hypothetical protein